MLDGQVLRFGPYRLDTQKEQFWHETQPVRLTTATGRRVSAHIVTQVRNRDAFVRAGMPLHDFTTIDSEAVAGRLPVAQLRTYSSTTTVFSVD